MRRFPGGPLVENDRRGLDYAQVLDEIQETGYEGTELGDWGFLPTEPERLADELAARELSLVGAFVQAPLWNPASHDDGRARALRAAHLLAATGGDRLFIILSDDNATVEIRTKNAGRIRPEHGLGPSQWADLIAGAELIARAVRDETGLRTTFHHHGGGYVRLQQRSKNCLTVAIQICWAYAWILGTSRSGVGTQPKPLRSFGDRIWHIHFKDFDPAVAAPLPNKKTGTTWTWFVRGSSAS